MGYADGQNDSEAVEQKKPGDCAPGLSKFA